MVWQILIENGGATGVEYVQDGEKRIATLAVGGEVSGDGTGKRNEKCPVVESWCLLFLFVVDEQRPE